MSRLGKNGRFGNQIFQYFFLKLVEIELGYEISAPTWFGNAIFNLDKTTPIKECANCFPIESFQNKKDFPELHLEKIKEIASLHNVHHIDISGYFQYHTRYLQKFRANFEDLFTINPDYLNRIEYSLEKIKKVLSP
jgi:hypothetical protein